MELAEDLATRLLRDALVPKNQNQEITIHHANPPPAPPAPPAPPWHAYVGAAGAIVCMLLTGFSLSVATDAKDEVRALRVEYSQRLDAERLTHEADVRELRQADRSFMAYINTGRMPAKDQGQKKGP